MITGRPGQHSFGTGEQYPERTGYAGNSPSPRCVGQAMTAVRHPCSTVSGASTLPKLAPTIALQAYDQPSQRHSPVHAF